MYKCTYLYVYNARKIKQNISCFVCTFICTFDFNKTHGNMKTHFYTAATIDCPRQLVEGTDQWPANSGLYLVTFKDGSIREEWYTVAFGWNDGKIEPIDIIKSVFIKHFKP